MSKHWQKTILGSFFLRRTLFLDAIPEKCYIENVLGTYGLHVPTIVHEYKQNITAWIVELHPALLPYSSPNDSLWVKDNPCDRLRSVHPSTLISQPPLEALMVAYTPRRSHGTTRGYLCQTGGVTFGSLLRGLDEIYMSAYGEAFDKSVHEVGEKDGETCAFSSHWAFTIDGAIVRTAREALLKV